MEGAIQLARAAYRRGREMLWPRVVERSLATCRQSQDWLQAMRRAAAPVGLPLDAIERMTDGVGMLQHAVYSVPDRDHGYCIDDNARALMMVVRRDDDRNPPTLASIFAAFIQHGWNPAKRRFRNFMGYDRQWLEACGSEDSNGRTLWALGMAAARSPSPGLRDWALKLFEEAAPYADELQRASGQGIRRAGWLRAACGRGPITILPLAAASKPAEQLMQLHCRYAREDWDWFEPRTRL